MTTDSNDYKQIIYVPAFPADFPHGQRPDSEIDLRELRRVIWNGKWFIAGFTLGCTLIAVFITLFVLPVTYKSEAVLIPTETPRGSAFAGLAANLQIPIGLGGEKSDSIMAFLNSRNLKERLLVKYDLLPHYYKTLVDDPKDRPSVVLALQRGVLKNIHGVSQDKKTKLITISWVDENPAFASLMIERIASELLHFLDHEYETDAKREREFVEQQLAKITAELEHWEHQVPAPDLPLAKIQRERLAAQTVYTELRKRLELVKIDESKELIRFKVLDAPFVPEKKFKPKRALITASTLMVAGIISILILLGNHAIRSRRGDKKNQKVCF
jgi:uncharacterized protein involved in exopolysaccharide biosynthesis